MTEAQVEALLHGLLGFIVVGPSVLVPQALSQRVRKGQVNVRRLVCTGAVLLYGCLALAVVLLPFPGPATPPLQQTVQLVPLQWIDDVGTEMYKYGLAPTIANALGTQTFQQAMMNGLLFVPLGVFSRMLWRRGLGGAFGLAAGVSLAVEIVQLTANFGTAPFVYRIFDVDDILNNTVGALLGWLLTAGFLALRRSSTADVPSALTHHRSRLAAPAGHASAPVQR